MPDEKIYTVEYKGNPILGATIGEVLRKAYMIDHPFSRGKPSRAAPSSWMLRAELDQIKNIDYGE